MTEKTFSIITICVAALTAIITLVWILTVNSKITETTKKWDVNKKTLTIILGLLAGLSISTGFKILVISINAVLIKEELEKKIAYLESNTLLTQLLNATAYFSIAGVIFMILGVRGFVVLLKKE